jgi:glycosyltransferase involved in cell wall biosynthesis
MKKVSIVVPVYNVENYLQKCLDSILNQTYSNIEIILVNDGSTDESEAIIKSFVASYPNKIKYISKENGGLNYARRDGFLLSEGEYVAFIDSDDVIAPKYIEILKQTLDKDASDIAMCGHIGFKDKLESFSYAGLMTSFEADKDVVLRWLIIGGAPWNDNRFLMTAWGSLIERSVLERMDWSFSNYRANEDEFWSMQLFKNMKKGFSSVNLGLYGYRNNPRSITTKPYSNIINGKPARKFRFIEHLYIESLSYLGDKFSQPLIIRLGENIVDFIDNYTDKDVIRLADIVEAQKLVRRYGKIIVENEVTSRVRRKMVRMLKISVMGYVLHRRLKSVRQR